MAFHGWSSSGTAVACVRFSHLSFQLLQAVCASWMMLYVSSACESVCLFMSLTVYNSLLSTRRVAL